LEGFGSALGKKFALAFLQTFREQTQRSIGFNNNPPRFTECGVMENGILRAQ